MSPVALLAIVVAAGEAGSPATEAMMFAAREALGSGAVVRLFETAAPTDAEALRIEQTQLARAVVQLAWRDASRVSARLRLHAVRTDRWIDRDITFMADDSVSERGRTLGFAIASMLPEADPRVVVAAAAGIERAPPEAEPPLGRRAVGFVAIGGAGLGGQASGLGGAAEAELFVADALSLHVEAGARLGTISQLKADELTSYLGGGAAWWPLAPTTVHNLGLGLRGDLLLLYHAVSHTSASGGGSTVEWKGQPLPGAHLKIQGTWRLGRSVELILAAGAEIAFGTIIVSVVPQAPNAGPATIPVLRAVAESGIRFRF
jgi:hypothetical protein